MARGFEGGQASIKRRFPKRGFRSNRFNTMKLLEKVNLWKISYHIEKGDIDPTKVITMKTMVEAGVLPKVKYGVKLLGRGM